MCHHSILTLVKFAIAAVIDARYRLNWAVLSMNESLMKGINLLAVDFFAFDRHVFKNFFQNSGQLFFLIYLPAVGPRAYTTFIDANATKNVQAFWAGSTVDSNWFADLTSQFVDTALVIWDDCGRFGVERNFIVGEGLNYIAHTYSLHGVYFKLRLELFNHLLLLNNN